MNLFHKTLFAAVCTAAVSLAAADAAAPAPTTDAAAPVAAAAPNPDVEAKKQFQEAEKLFQKNFPNSGVVYDLRYVEQALDVYRGIQKTPGLSASMQIQLAQKIATCLLELDRRSEAFAELDNALKIKDLPPAQVQQIELFRADRLVQTSSYDEALKIYLKYERNETAFQCMLKAGKRQDAVDFIRKNGANGPRIEQLCRMSQIPGLDQLVLDALLFDLEAANDKVDDDAWMKALVPAVRLQLKFDHEKALALAENYADAVKAPAYYDKLFLNREAYQEFSTDLKFTGKVLALAEKRNPDSHKINQAKYVDFWFASGELAKLKELFAKMDPKAKSQNDQLMEAVLFNTMNAEQIAELAKDKKPEQKVAFLANAAGIASRCKNEKLTRELWSLREKMLVQQARPSLKCSFTANAPSDIAGFLAMPKDPKDIGTLDRKFGNQLQLLLETDASTTTRTISKDKQLAGYTTFSAVCSAQGVDFFFVMPCTKEKADGIRLGTQSMGGFEIYLAPGFDKPYHTLILGCPPNEEVYDTFMTEYTNADFVRAMVRNKNVKVSFRVDDDKVLMLLHLDWTVCIDRVPQDGEYWEFEPIHWEQGGLSWGGSQSVHNRSCCGKIVFANMTKANRAAIMRRLLLKVKDSFWRQWSAWQRGFAEHYADPELGDPEFYAEVLLPLKTKYEAYAKRIIPEMTDDEAILIYNEAFYPMYNIRHIVEKLRHEYIQKQLTTPSK